MSFNKILNRANTYNFKKQEKTMIYPKPFYENYPDTTDGSANTAAEAFFGKRAYLYLSERVFRGGKARLMRELYKNFYGRYGQLKNRAEEFR